jgi:hypothetical protein
MNAKKLGRFLVVMSCCFSSVAFAQAEPVPIPFQFTFCGDQATATGYITFDLNQMSNPFFGIDYAAVLDLQVDVSGASAGNGTYGRDDFEDIAWESNGGTIDFGMEFVGQPTDGLPWGTSNTSGEAGDFNLFSSGNTLSAPNGEFYFLLGANDGQADSMTLRTFAPGPPEIGEPSCPPALIPPSTSVPTLDRWGLTLLILAFMGLAVVGYRRLNA